MFEDLPLPPPVTRVAVHLTPRRFVKNTSSVTRYRSARERCDRKRTTKLNFSLELDRFRLLLLILLFFFYIYILVINRIAFRCSVRRDGAIKNKINGGKKPLGVSVVSRD